MRLFPFKKHLLDKDDNERIVKYVAISLNSRGAERTTGCAGPVLRGVASDEIGCGVTRTRIPAISEGGNH